MNEIKIVTINEIKELLNKLIFYNDISDEEYTRIYRKILSEKSEIIIDEKIYDYDGLYNYLLSKEVEYNYVNLDLGKAR